jgi:hypothetical protein
MTEDAALNATRDARDRYWPIIIQLRAEIDRLAALNAELRDALRAAESNQQRKAGP